MKQYNSCIKSDTPPPNSNILAAINSDNVIIAGNGPSLAEIDYSRLPLTYDVFRCNQFYFEDKYYLGRKIKKAFFNPSVFREQLYTTHKLELNGDYEIEEVVLGNNIPMQVISDDLYYVLSGFTLGFEVYLSKLPEFVKHLRILDHCEGRRPTAGVYMCAVAIACGYKNIYLTGIDFYSGNLYVFDQSKSKIGLIHPRFVESSPDNCHSESCDLEFLQFLQDTYSVNIYVISPNSKSAVFYPLAPQLNPTPKFSVEEKSANAIKDILIPPHTPWNFNKGLYKDQIINKIAEQEEKIMQLTAQNKNLILRLILDLFRLPSAIKHAYRAKRHKMK